MPFRIYFIDAIIIQNILYHNFTRNAIDFDKICEEKLSADPRIALNNPIIKDLIQHKRFTELTKEIMDAFVSTIWVHEKIETNPETNKEESNLNVEVGFKFEKL